MANVLEVQIVGDISSLEKSLKQAEQLQADYASSIDKTSKELSENIAISRNYSKAIGELAKEYKQGAITSKEYASQLEKLKRDEKETTVVTAQLRKELATLKREQKDLGTSFQKDLTPKVANGGNALMQFSRIAQDAPYGIIGIGNNITATVEAFGHLQKSAGGAGGALKAMGASLVGSGGILLAVSLVTTGLTYMSQNGITLSDVVKKMTGNFNAARKAAQDLNVEAVKGSQGQISTMNAYVATAKNVNLSMNDRLIAVQKLQSEYPAYFGNLTQEQILNGNVAIAVAGATKALIAKAKAAASIDKIVKLAEEEEIAQNNLKNEILSISKAYGLSKKEAFEYSKAVLSGADAFKLLEPYKNRAGFFDVAGAVASTNSIMSLRNELFLNKKEQDKLTKSVGETTAAYIKLDKASGGSSNAGTTDTTPKIKAVPQLEPFDPSAVKKDYSKELKLLQTYFGDASAEFKSTKIPLDIPLQLNTGRTFEAYELMLEEAYENTKIFADASGAAIGALANDLAKSFETGNSALDAFVGSIIQGLAQVAAAQLTALIAKQAVATTSLSTDAAVATGNAVVAATETASATGPAAAFVLPALVGAAIGFIAAAFSGIKFAHGGIVPNGVIGGGSYTGDKIPAMLNSGETVLNNRQQANMLMAIANGNSSSLQSNGSAVETIGEVRLRGEDIYLMMKRQEKKR